MLLKRLQNSLENTCAGVRPERWVEAYDLNTFFIENFQATASIVFFDLFRGVSDLVQGNFLIFNTP